MLQEQYTLHLPSRETQMYNMSDIHLDYDGQELFNVVDTIMRDGSQMVSFPLTPQWHIVGYANNMFKVAKKRKEETSSLCGRDVQDKDYFLPYISEKTPYVHATDWTVWWGKIVFGDTIKFQSVDWLCNAKVEAVKGLKLDAVSLWKYAMDRFLAIMHGENGNVESKDPSPNTTFDTKVFHDAASSICASLKDQLKEEEKTKVFLVHVYFAHRMLEDWMVAFKILAKSNILWEYRNITIKQKGLMRIFELMKAKNLH
ncbi:hypothetical protein ACEPAF_7952 [Sanghuangporus sanghuang]